MTISLRTVLKGLRVPTHRVDAPGLLILPHDDAWDHERIEAERAELVEMALAEAKSEALKKAAEQAGCEIDALPAETRASAEVVILSQAEKDEAISVHPWSRYFACQTRYQLDAPDQGPRGPACARDYLLPGKVHTTFELRRIPWRERARIDLEHDSVTRWTRLVETGVARIATGEDVLWEMKSPTDRVPSEVIDLIADANPANIVQIAGACHRFSAPLSETEGKP